MMDLFKRYQNIIIIALLVVLGFIAYSYLGVGKSAAPLTASPATTPVEEQLIALLLELKSIKLDAAIFANASFQSLSDFSQTLVPEPVGRTNPFAPIGK